MQILDAARVVHMPVVSLIVKGGAVFRDEDRWQMVFAIHRQEHAAQPLWINLPVHLRMLGVGLLFGMSPLIDHVSRVVVDAEKIDMLGEQGEIVRLGLRRIAAELARTRGG